MRWKDPEAQTESPASRLSYQHYHA